MRTNVLQVYHNKLGMQSDRVERVWGIAQAIGLQLGGKALEKQAGEVAMLAKADLPDTKHAN